MKQSSSAEPEKTETALDSNKVTRYPLPILTSLRLFAAAEVVIFHYADKDHLFPFYSELFNGWTGAGYQAVTFFFVLSGFILTYVYSSTNENTPITISAREFLKARIARISPAYFLALGLALPAFVYSAFISKLLAFDVFVAGVFLVPTFLQSWYPPTAFAWNGPAWSLSVEMLFYVSFHFLCRIGQHFTRNVFLVLFYLIVVTAAILRQLWLPFPPLEELNSWYFNFGAYFPIFHLPQFLFGVALGRVYLFGKAVSPKIHLRTLLSGN
jgi:peptidoglycan/LPS O-acetylase OafA/YrhL